MSVLNTKEMLERILEQKSIEKFEFPNVWTIRGFEGFTKWASLVGVSDIVFKSGESLFVRLDGIWMPVGHQAVKNEELIIVINEIARSNSSVATIFSGRDMDFPYEVTVSRGIKNRFRCNATATSLRRGVGISLTMRTIPSMPPTVEDLGVEEGILKHAFIDKGLVLVTGVMGSGKSTLLSAILRKTIETGHKNIITYENPIEFDLTAIPNKTCLVQQTEIPEHLTEGFGAAIRNSARRAADIILVGESRDPETLRGMLEAAEIGTATYSTVHTRSVYETPARIINVFDKDEQSQIAATLIPSLMLIVQQRLLPRADKPGRVALKEYLGFTQKIKRKLMSIPPDEITVVLQDIVNEDGHSLLKDLEEKYDKGLVFEEDYLQIKKEIELN